jgi:hypothetical protein
LSIAYLTQRPHAARRTSTIPIPQGLDEGGHRLLPIPYRTQRLTRRTRTSQSSSLKAWMRGGHRLHAYLHQRPHAAARTYLFPSRKAWMRWGTAGAPIFTNASHAAARTSLFLPQGLDEGGHRLRLSPIVIFKAWMRGGTACLSPSHASHAAARTSLIPIPKAWMRGDTACPSPIFTNASHAATRTCYSPIFQGLDEGGHRLPIAYLTQRLATRTASRTNIPIASPSRKAWMRWGTAGVPNSTTAARTALCGNALTNTPQAPCATT